jgi:hypothetical protein
VTLTSRGPSDGTAVARNQQLRDALHRAFPNDRITVRNGPGGSARAHWTDGPTEAAVRAVLNGALSPRGVPWKVILDRNLSPRMLTVAYLRCRSASQTLADHDAGAAAAASSAAAGGGGGGGELVLAGVGGRPRYRADLWDGWYRELDEGGAVIRAGDLRPESTIRRSIQLITRASWSPEAVTADEWQLADAVLAVTGPLTGTQLTIATRIASTVYHFADALTAALS